jgi:hypothetical protein
MKFMKLGARGPAPCGDLRDPGKNGSSVRVELLRFRTLRLLERRSRGVGGDRVGDSADIMDVAALDGALEDP